MTQPTEPPRPARDPRDDDDVIALAVVTATGKPVVVSRFDGEQTHAEAKRICRNLDAWQPKHDTPHRVVPLVPRATREPMSDAEPVRVDQRANGCWAACVATLTGIPLDALDQNIPPDASEEWFWENATSLYNDMVRRLREHGWRIERTWRDVPRGFAIASGASPRYATVQHAVVVRDGELWHDPHPSRAGLASVEGYEVLIPLVVPSPTSRDATTPEDAR
jgi:hypothetical protein